MDNTLKIKYLRDEDSGLYECVGQNRAGSDRRTLRLDVTGSIDVPAVIGGSITAGLILLGRVCHGIFFDGNKDVNK